MQAVDFWSSNPCDGQADLAARRHFRYGKEPWLPPVLDTIAARHSKLLEVGCGQGTDALQICRALKPGSTYLGIDYSSGSVASARSAIHEAGPLPVTPVFERGDACSLPFGDDSFDAVYSMGVLHHIDDTDKAIAEVFRVLQPGGTAYVALYNSTSIKLRAAHALRAMQSAVDKMTGSKNALLALARRVPERVFGTMFIECFGVPVLKSYTSAEMTQLFGRFNVERCERVGHMNSFWFIEAQKT
jgi:ubiquinone/menaquinone biosynthesis C-methylase UbiE